MILVYPLIFSSLSWLICSSACWRASCSSLFNLSFSNRAISDCSSLSVTSTAHKRSRLISTHLRICRRFRFTRFTSTRNNAFSFVFPLIHHQKCCDLCRHAIQSRPGQWSFLFHCIQFEILCVFIFLFIPLCYLCLLCLLTGRFGVKDSRNTGIFFFRTLVKDL